MWPALKAWGYDDPFITYRYARHLAEGAGFVYNTGERVLSTTTPLFTLLLAATAPLWRLGLDIPQIANFIGVLCLGMGGLLLSALVSSSVSERLKSSLRDVGVISGRHTLAGWAGILLYPCFPLFLSTIGSETPLYLALCLGAFVAYARRHYVLTGLVTGLACLTRPDGILVAVVLALDYFFSSLHYQSAPNPRPSLSPRFSVHVSRLLIPLLSFLAIVLPWVIFAWVYYGSPVPATLFTKQQQGAMLISQRFGPGFLYLLKGYAQHWFAWVEVLLAVAGVIALFNKGSNPGSTRSLLPLFGWTILYFVTYACLGVSRYHWYYAPLVPAFILLVGLGSGLPFRDLLFQKVKHIRGQPVGLRTLWHFTLPLAIMIGIFALAIAQMATGGLFAGGRRPSELTLRDPRLEVYRQAGAWLRMNAPANARVAALEIGIMGYYAEGRFIDFAGLLQPEVAAQIKPESTYADVAGWVVDHYQPDFLALNRGVFTNLEQGYAPQKCQLVKKIPETSSDGTARNSSSVVSSGNVLIDIYDCTK